MGKLRGPLLSVRPFWGGKGRPIKTKGSVDTARQKPALVEAWTALQDRRKFGR